MLAIAAGLTTALIDPDIIPLGIAGAAVIVFLLYLVTSPLQLVPPENFSTFGDLTQKLVGLKHATKSMTKDTAFADIQKIVAETLGVDSDEVVPNARFIEDLNMN